MRKLLGLLLLLGSGAWGQITSIPNLPGVGAITSSTPVTVLAEFRAALCQNATAILAFGTPTSNPAAAACVTGSNTQLGVADFDASTDQSVQDALRLPPTFTGAVDLDIEWFAAATSGDVIWAVQTACVAATESVDPSFNTASTVTDTAQGTTNRMNTASISSVTITGCATNERLLFKFYRDADAGGDTMTGNARLVSLRFTIRRTL